MGIDNRDQDGGQKQQGGTQGTGPEGGEQLNNPGKANNPNGQRERGSDTEKQGGNQTGNQQSGSAGRSD